MQNSTKLHLTFWSDSVCFLPADALGFQPPTHPAEMCSPVDTRVPSASGLWCLMGVYTLTTLSAQRKFPGGCLSQSILSNSGFGQRGREFVVCSRLLCVSVHSEAPLCVCGGGSNCFRSLSSCYIEPSFYSFAPKFGLKPTKYINTPTTLFGTTLHYNETKALFVLFSFILKIIQHLHFHLEEGILYSVMQNMHFIYFCVL